MVGAGYVIQTVLREVCTLASGTAAYVLAPRGICRLNLRKYGQWAGRSFLISLVLYSICSSMCITTVVTGASEGIGRGYALEVRQITRAIKILIIVSS